MLSEDCEHIPWFSKVTNLVDSLQSHCDELRDGRQVSRHMSIPAEAEPDRADTTIRMFKAQVLFHGLEIRIDYDRPDRQSIDEDT